MYKQTLNGEWNMQKVGGDKVFKAFVPTTMYQVLFENDQIADPYIDENDRALTALSDDDYVFYRDFQVNSDILDNDRVELEFLGLDTLSTIYLNQTIIGKTDNMHCEYTYDVKHLLTNGVNSIRIEFKSPNVYIAKEQNKDPLWGVANPLPGYEHLRKAHHMFGWDWGPQLPDMGIWRPVTLKAYSIAKLENYYITQVHKKDYVRLEIDVELSEQWIEIKKRNPKVQLSHEILDPKKHNIFQGTSEIDHLVVDIKNPELWWPNGYGEHPLYTVVIKLVEEDRILDTLTKRIGLRTVTMTREKDEYGESFDMTVNGLRIFAMGADYIPEDILINTMSKERTRDLLEDCKLANFNHMRVWGGAFYPDDYFYDICDEFGLLVWQDFMFACGVYRLREKFQESITREITQNVRRIRHHACMALWCGNNEMEMGLVDWGIPNNESLRMDYLIMYEKLIPGIVAEQDPEAFYWPASPSSGGGFLNPNGDDKGDVHYWEVFHGNKHYKEVRKHFFRFASEFGMQSFPDIKTIEHFAKEEDRQIYGPVMENHNKCLGDINGNMKIMMNMSGEFDLPNNLDDIVYISQVFQGETIRCAVEHFRRNRGRCMGSTYWQVNDNWPVSSWSSIDYYGRWKALHYMVKRFYAPSLVSGFEKGTKGYIHISNESRSELKGTLQYQIRHIDKGILEDYSLPVLLEACTSREMVTVDIKKYINGYGDERNIYLSFQLWQETKDEEVCVSSDSILFVAHKHFNFRKADIKTEVFEDENGFGIKLTSSTYAKSVGVLFNHFDVILSDNYIDLLPNETVELRVIKVKAGVELSKTLLDENLRIKAVNSINYI